VVAERGKNGVLTPDPQNQGSALRGQGSEDQVVAERGKNGVLTPDPSPLTPTTKGLQFDVQVPLMSLPMLFGTSITTIPSRIPYLSAEPARVEHWQKRLHDVPGLKVGIAWQGNLRHKWDRQRSFPLALLRPLADIPGVSLVSLQKGPGAEQIPYLRDRFAVLDLGSELTTFADTAALMKCLDLVVCCDSSVAHLAGALGVPVWVAISIIADWRWLLEREDSPWYPTMRLFRQRRIGRWRPVFKRMAGELGRVVRSE
jgi:hypothetical protein